MDAFLIYILKTSICLTIFYICIKAFLSKETFHHFNRLVILTGTSTCFILPLIRVEIPEYSAVQKPFLLIEEVFIQDDIAITEQSSQQNSFIGDSASITEKGNIAIGTIILIVYIAGGFINLTILFSSVYSMFRLIHNGSKLKKGNNTFIIVPKDINPFSWGKYIVLSEIDYNNNPIEIITHEVAHIKHRHSIDLIFMELVILVQWFNPAVWLLKRELKDIHEYQADISVLQSGINATKYQLLLVKKAVGTSSYTLANSFNHSKIKKRITMMLKEKSSKWARLKLLLLLPLGTLTMFAFARTEVNEPLSSLVKYESTDNLSEAEMLKKELLSSVNADKNQNASKPVIKFTPPKIKKDGDSFSGSCTNKTTER